MRFNNRTNTPHEINGKIIWESRSVAVVGVIIIYQNSIPYVLVSKRGPNSADFKGKMNLVAGYLDWNESGSEGFIREAWEETGFNLPEHLSRLKVHLNNLDNPWSISSTPSNNLQNVSLRFGVIFELPKNEKLPELTTEHNEVEGEVEDPMWMKISDVYKYDWAFNHDKTINSYNLYSMSYLNLKLWKITMLGIKLKIRTVKFAISSIKQKIASMFGLVKNPMEV